MATRRQHEKAFRVSLLDVASRLNEPDIQKVCFLYKDKINKQCRCRFHSASGLEPDVSCPFHRGLTGVVVMEQLLERGEFNECMTEPLVDMLNEIGRVDLANTFVEEYVNVQTQNNGSPELKPLSHNSSPQHNEEPMTRLCEIRSREVRPDVEVDIISQQFLSHKVQEASPEHVSSDLIAIHSDKRCTDMERDFSDTHHGISPSHTDKVCGCVPRRTTRSDSLTHMDRIRAHSLHCDSVDGSNERFSCSTPTELSVVELVSPLSTESTSPELQYAVILSKSEVQEITRMINDSPDTDPKMVRLLSNKLITAKPADEQSRCSSFSDDCEIIEKEEYLSLSFPRDKFTLRAFSLDSVNTSRMKKVVTHSSVPEISQSCVHVSNGSWDHVQGCCGCQGACFHSPELNTFQIDKTWKDSGMGFSLESNDAAEDLMQGYLYSPPSRQGVVLNEWKVPRSKMLNHIFYHKNSSMDKKVHICTGSGKTRRSVNILLRLHPDGLGVDRGTYSTLVVDVKGISHPKLKLSVDFTVRVIDTQDETIVSLRNFRLDLTQKSHTMFELLSHEIIKQSSAKNFKFMLKFQLQLPMNREWVVVN